ncbi:hypothetical protein UY3_00130 [Chelonia mydas]|uniref:Secreted protein n=1 Tax=Chelonia mydas TaxID=8469 RepID=M7C376_CHEMY|nr:hypothetical protein UY3_00130 [Chelonia mydas]
MSFLFFLLLLLLRVRHSMSVEGAPLKARTAAATTKTSRCSNGFTVPTESKRRRREPFPKLNVIDCGNCSTVGVTLVAAGVYQQSQSTPAFMATCCPSI